MNIKNIYCENCDSYAISENYRKELDRMEDGEVVLCICCDCGHDNFIQKEDDDIFEHFKAIVECKDESF